jgi:hypothetical protein
MVSSLLARLWVSIAKVDVLVELEQVLWNPVALDPGQAQRVAARYV